MVERDRFNYLVNNYNSLTSEETAELRLEQDRYGYCQVLHQLIARGDQDNQTAMKEQSLHVAAVYSTDRSVLKQLMTVPRADRLKEQSAIPQQEPEVNIVPGEVISTPPPMEIMKAEKALEEKAPKETEPKQELKISKSEPEFDVDEALSKFMSGLKPMHEKKLEFEKAIEEFERQVQESKPEKLKSGDKPKQRGRPKKQGAKSTAKAKEKSSNTSDKLLDDIKTTKKKVTPESKKQQEQSEIIDQFIKAKPTISKPPGNQEQIDLADQLEGYNENVVSETLALILIKQGKKEKAVEVLRKLIWKFPQKKAYFAAQIEDLTK